jgi:Hydantoinase/oxoprolinase
LLDNPLGDVQSVDQTARTPESCCSTIPLLTLPGSAFHAAIRGAPQRGAQFRGNAPCERTNKVALNAYVQPIIRNYFDGLHAALRRKRIHCPYYARPSNGGIASFEQVVTAPSRLLNSVHPAE